MQDRDREEQVPQRRANHCKGAMMGQDSLQVGETKMSTQPANMRGLEEKTESGFRIRSHTHRDISWLDLVEHEKQEWLYTEREK